MTTPPGLFCFLSSSTNVVRNSLDESFVFCRAFNSPDTSFSSAVTSSVNVLILSPFCVTLNSNFANVRLIFLPFDFYSKFTTLFFNFSLFIICCNYRKSKQREIKCQNWTKHSHAHSHSEQVSNCQVLTVSLLTRLHWKNFFVVIHIRTV